VARVLLVSVEMVGCFCFVGGQTQGPLSKNVWAFFFAFFLYSIANISHLHEGWAIPGSPGCGRRVFAVARGYGREPPVGAAIPRVA